MIAADTLIVNGKVATVDRAFSMKEAIAVKDGWIIDVGTNAEISRYKGADTKVIDLGGKLILPGAHDAHIHGIFFAIMKRCVNCGAPAVWSLDELRATLRAEAERLPEGAWIRGVNLNFDAFPECAGKGITRWDIDEATCGRPAIIMDWSNHGGLANSRALELSGITRDTPDPVGGYIVKEKNGEPTGYLQEASATFLVFKYAPLWTDDELIEAIYEIQALLNSEGYTGYTECLLGPANNEREYGTAGERGIFLYRKLADEGKLTARVSVGFYSGVNGIQSYDYLLNDLNNFNFPDEPDPLWFKVPMVKIFCDGVHIFHSAWMREPYANLPGSHGRSCLCSGDASDDEQAEELCRMIELAHTRGFQVGVHAIGDRAIDETLNGFINAYQKYPGKNLRHYIIHAEGLGWPDQAEKAARYKIPYSIQPTISDYAFEPTIECIGSRGESGFDIKTPLDKGVTLCGGSDAMAGEFSNWRMAVQSAVTRRSAISGKVYAPELRVSVEDAVRMFTINAVYQEKMEDVRGSIEIGKLADFQVLDRDIFDTPHDEIGAIKVVMTIVDGKVVYDRRQP